MSQNKGDAIIEPDNKLEGDKVENTVHPQTQPDPPVNSAISQSIIDSAQTAGVGKSASIGAVSVYSISFISQLCQIVLPIIAIVVAVWQINVGRDAQKEATAKQIWREYLSLTFNNASLARVKKQELCEWKHDKESEKYEKYAYFVGHLLFSSEEIFLSTKRSEGWVATLKDELALHADYLCSEKNWENWVDASFAPIVYAALNDCSGRTMCPQERNNG